MGFQEQLAGADFNVRQLLKGTEVIVYTPSSGPPVTVLGIFDAGYVKVEAGLAGVSSVGPAVFLTLADLPTDPSVDNPTVTVDGAVYFIAESKPDNQGGVLLFLHQNP